MKKIKNVFFFKNLKKNHYGTNFSFPIKNLKITKSVIDRVFFTVKKYFMRLNDTRAYRCLIYIVNRQEILTLGPSSVWNKFSSPIAFRNQVLKNLNEKIFYIYRWKKIDYIILNLTRWPDSK